MRRRSAKILVIVIGFMLLPSAASAISNGEPDGVRHPNVGFLAVSFVDGPGFERCSGTLIGPDLFLTSAHCVVTLLPSYDAGELFFWVGFDPVFDGNDMSRWIPVTEVLPNPAYPHGDDSGDLAIIRFDPSALPDGVVLAAPPQLPPAGLLDTLQADAELRGTRFTLVGFGLGAVFDRGKPYWENTRLRNVATAAFQSLGPSYFRIHEIPQTGNGGICYGDSGGPFFLGDTNLLVGVSGLTDYMCRANGGALRLDSESSRAFLGQFLPLP